MTKVFVASHTTSKCACPGAPPVLTTERRRGRERAPVNYREPAVYDLGFTTDARTGNASTPADAATRPGAAAADVTAFEGFDYERDGRVVENEATKKATHWVVNNRGLWARQAGRFRLPAGAARKAARQCALSHARQCCLNCPDDPAPRVHVLDQQATKGCATAQGDRCSRSGVDLAPCGCAHIFAESHLVPVVPTNDMRCGPA